MGPFPYFSLGSTVLFRKQIWGRLLRVPFSPPSTPPTQSAGFSGEVCLTWFKSRNLFKLSWVAVVGDWVLCCGRTRLSNPLWFLPFDCSPRWECSEGSLYGLVRTGAELKGRLVPQPFHTHTSPLFSSRVPHCMVPHSHWWSGFKASMGITIK